jgi:assimilatory nitrate reductase catalytic subunit
VDRVHEPGAIDARSSDGSQALARAELVVLQESYRGTETEAYADVLLPAASWGEKEGTVTNSERRISRVRAAIPPRAKRARIGRLPLLRAPLGNPIMSRRTHAVSLPTCRRDFRRARATTRGRDLDIGGLSYARLERDGPQQWPCPTRRSGVARAFIPTTSFATPDGRARFAAPAYVPVAERVDARFPFRLTTGRLRDQWHGMSRTGTIAALYAHAPEPVLELHRADAARRGLRPAILFESSRGAVQWCCRLRCRATSGPDAPIYRCTGDPPHSPAAMGRASTRDREGVLRDVEATRAQARGVRIEKAALPWRLVAFGFPRDAKALAPMRDQARALALPSITQASS